LPFANSALSAPPFSLKFPRVVAIDVNLFVLSASYPKRVGKKKETPSKEGELPYQQYFEKVGNTSQRPKKTLIGSLVFGATVPWPFYDLGTAYASSIERIIVGGLAYGV